jgi:kynureninase
VLSQEQIDNAIVPLSVRPGEDHLRTEDILSTLQELGDEVAVVWIGCVQYYTGQFFEIAPIAKKAHEIGAVIGLDLAHAIGNVPVRLNEWDVDFAAWCTYK